MAEVRKKKTASIIPSGNSSPFYLILRVAAIVFTALCLFGIFDQLVLAGAVYNWTLHTAGVIGENIEYIFTGDERAPLDVTDHGVYIDGHAPEGANTIDFTDGNNDEENNEDNSNDNNNKSEKKSNNKNQDNKDNKEAGG